MKKKKYIILSLSIYGINGAVQYLYNKITALRTLGYTVILFTGNNGRIIDSLSHIYIPELEEYSHYIISELQYPPVLFGEKKRKVIIDSILRSVCDSESGYLIEANSIATAEWGELLSKELRTPCFWFDLQEKYSFNESEIKFVKKKIKDSAIAGISPESFPLMTKGSVSKGVFFKAYCSNTIQDVPFNIPNDVLLSDYRIGIIGRLNKPFVYPTLVTIRNYMTHHSESRFSLVLIGGAPQKDLERIRSQFSGLKNISLFITDYIYPVPQKLVKCVDVFVSSSGSAVATMREGVPTIVIDADSNKPIGILDYTINSDTYGEETYNLEDLLDDILYKKSLKECEKKGMEEDYKAFDYVQEVWLQIEYVMKAKYSPYNINEIRPNNKYYRLLQIIARVFGSRCLDRVRRFVHWK